MGRLHLLGAALAAAVLATALTVGPSYASTTSAQRAAVKLARSELLKRSLLPGGWRIDSPAPHSAGSPTCARFHPRLPAFLGSAVSPVFAPSSSGPFLAEAIWVYSSAAQARTAWRRVARRGFRHCVAESLTAGSGNGVTFTADRSRMLRSFRMGSNVRFRVSGIAATSGQTTPVYLDEVLLLRGRSIGVVSLSSFSLPPHRALELRLTRLAAKQMTNS
jgi:hypothetical protein